MILVASIDAFLVDVVQDLLGVNFQLVAVNSVSQALEKLEEQSPEVMIIDLDLPNLNEGDSSQKLVHRLHEQAVPILMVVEAIDGIAESDWEALDIQGDEILFKDFTPDRMVQKINRLLSLRANREKEEPDRRSAPRLPVDVEIVTNNQKGILVGSANNISVGGVYLELEKLLDKNQIVKMRFRIPGAKRTLTVQGEVVWAREIEKSNAFGVGIRFIDLDEQDLDEIFSYTQTLLKIMKPCGV